MEISHNATLALIEWHWTNATIKEVSKMEHTLDQWLSSDAEEEPPLNMHRSSDGVAEWTPNVTITNIKET
jgi:hypothetical protein